MRHYPARVAARCLVVAVLLTFAGGRAGADRPPGWDRGEKKGWGGGSLPPGLAKKGGWLPPGLSGEDLEDWEAAGGPPGWSRGRKTGWRGGSLPPGPLRLRAADMRHAAQRDNMTREQREQENTMRRRPRP